MEDFKFYMPTAVYSGKGVVQKQRELFRSYGKKAYIISYKIPGRHLAMEDVTAVLESAGIPYMVDTSIEENPCTETVADAARQGLEFGADFIVGIGGGSPLDAAKAVGVLMKNPDVDPSALYSNATLMSIPILAIPTTAGTGSEVTHFAVLTRTDKETKQAIAPRIFPEVAMLDATYLTGMPERLTRSTAIDALCHCIESYVSTAGSFLSRALCEIGFQTFAECVQAMKDGNYTFEIREKQMMVSLIGGMCNTQTGTSLPHGMSYALTHYRHISHGLACGLLEVEYLRIFKDKTRINRIVDLCGFSDLNAFGEFIDSMLQLDVEVTEEELESYATEFAAQKHRFARHPEPAGKAEVLQIYRNSLLK